MRIWNPNQSDNFHYFPIQKELRIFQLFFHAGKTDFILLRTGSDRAPHKSLSWQAAIHGCPVQ